MGNDSAVKPTWGTVRLTATDSIPLRACGIYKSFGPNKVLQGVDFDVRAGEVHALLGENGAGKTTLLRILSGRQQPNDGTIETAGHHYSGLNPAQAQALGIEIVPQLVELIDDLSIADNIFLGRWPTNGIWIDQQQMQSRSADVLARVGIDLDPRTMVRELSYVEKQMVEIARINQFKPRVIILDEPTAALSVREIAILFDLINKLRAAGIGFVFVTHFLNEVSRMSDRTTILRDGAIAATGPTSHFTLDDMVKHMVGSVADLYTKHDRPYGTDVFSITNARTELIEDFSLHLREREIVGIAAPKGEGVSEMLRAVCRISGRLENGQLQIRECPVHIRSPADALRHGIGYLSEDRARWGIIHGRGLRENITVSTLKQFASRIGFLRLDQERQTARQLVDKFWVTTPGLDADMRSLSGGNQQKALVSRLFHAKLSVYILDDPTFGVDVKAKAQLHRLIVKETARGAGVIMHSSDLDELVQMCDRILLVKRGRIDRQWLRGKVSLRQLEESIEQ